MIGLLALLLVAATPAWAWNDEQPDAEPGVLP